MTARSDRDQGGDGRPARSPRLFGLFARYARGYVSRHFHAVRVASGGPRPPLPAGPLVVVVNHPSWWDPLIGLVFAAGMAGRVHYAPIERSGLARYPFLGRLGFFGVETGTASGARAFLRQATALLADPSAVLWVTAQGRFVDPRARPLGLKEGVGHLAHRLTAGTVWTMALEYPFWTERTPEALVRFGPPLAIEPDQGLSPAAWTARIEAALLANQDALARDAIARDPSRFDTVLAGGAGVGGVYDAWRRLKAAWRGERFEAAHGEIATHSPGPVIPGESPPQRPAPEPSPSLPRCSPPSA